MRVHSAFRGNKIVEIVYPLCCFFFHIRLERKRPQPLHMLHYYTVRLECRKPQYYYKPSEDVPISH